MSDKLIRTIQNGHQTSDLYGQLKSVMDMILILKEKELEIKTHKDLKGACFKVIFPYYFSFF